MATPHVTGVAALLAAYDSSLDWRAIKNRIIAGGTNVSTLAATMTGKRLDAYGALTCANSEVLGRRMPRNGGTSVAVGGKLKISALHINCGAPAGEVDVRIEPGGTVLTLHDDGNAPDAVAGDGVYSAYFEPQAAGMYTATLPNGDSFTIDVLKTYKFSTNSYNYRTILGTNLHLQDETVATLTTPFPVHFGGQTFSTLYVGDNGLISFDHPFNIGPALYLPYFEGGAFVAPWWDDFQPLYPGDQNVFWDVSGTAPNRELIIEWRNVPHYYYSEGDGNVTFQAVFSESTDDVVFNYANVKLEGMWYQYSAAALGIVGVQTDPHTATTYTSYGIFNSAAPQLTNQSSLLWQTVDVDFLLNSPTPAQLTIPNGGSQSFTMQVSAVGPLNRSVQLACANLPAGANCSISPSPISPVEGTPVVATVTVSASTETALPDFSLTLSATAADFVVAKTLNIPVHVTPSAGFVLSSNVSSYSMASWESASIAVNVGKLDGYSNTVNLSCSVAPAGPTCSVSPASLTPAGQVQLNIAGNGAAASSGYQATLQGSDGKQSHSLVIPLGITDYLVIPTPLSIIQQPALAAFFIYSQNGYRGTIKLACDASALPGAPVCVTQPSQITLSDANPKAVTVTVNGAQYTPGAYPVKLLTTPQPAGPTRITSDQASILGVSIAIQGTQEPTLAVGQSTTMDLLINSTVPITSGLDLSVFSCPYMVTCAITPSHVDLNATPVHATLTLSLPSATGPGLSNGNASLMIQASISSASYMTYVSTAVHLQDFALFAPQQSAPLNASEIDIALGKPTSTAFIMQETSGLNVPVTVECSQDLPPGLSCQFDRSLLNAGETAMLTLVADAAMGASTRYVDLIATASINGRQIRHVQTQFVRIGTFSLTMEPDTLSLPVGGEGVYVVYSQTNDYAGDLGSLSCSAPGAGIVCEAPLIDTTGNRTAVTVRSTPGVTPIGSYKFNVTLTALGEAETVQGTLNVQGTNAIVVTSPNGYELWTSGSQNITWKYYGDPGSTVKIELLKNGSVVQTIADQVPIGSAGEGLYTWAIPDALPFSQYYKIRVTSDSLPTATDDSDERVFIGRGVDFATNMTGAVWFTGGDYLVINYVWSGLSNVRLDLYKAGKFVQNIAPQQGSGYFDFAPWEWSIVAFGTPAGIQPGTDYSLLLVPTDDPTHAVMSPNFTISTTSITIVSPKLNDVYKPGDTIHIQWTWVGNPVLPGKDLTLTCCGVYQSYVIDRAAPLGANGSGAMDWVLPADMPQSNSYNVVLQANAGPGAAQSPTFWVGQVYTLTASSAPHGQIQTADYHIVCGIGSTACSAMYFKDTTITLQAVPDYGFAFTGWTGACSGSGTCVIQMESNVSVGATFASSNDFDMSGVDLVTKTVKAGQSAQYTFTITPGARMPNDISFSCLGLPAYSSCAFTPPTVSRTSGKTLVAMTITTKNSTSARLQHSLWPAPSTALGVVCMVVGQLFFPAWRRRRIMTRVLAVLSVVALSFLLSCSGGGGGGGNTPPVVATPPGTYTITMQATAGTTTNTESVQLIVQ